MMVVRVQLIILVVIIFCLVFFSLEYRTETLFYIPLVERKGKEFKENGKEEIAEDQTKRKEGVETVINWFGGQVVIASATDTVYW